MTRTDIAFGFSCIGVALAVLGVTGLILGSLASLQGSEDGSGFDPFAMLFWRRHRRMACVFVAIGSVIMLFVAFVLQPLV